VQKRLVKYGFNEIPEKRSSFLVRFAKRFWGLVPWMLEITAILTFFLGKYPAHPCHVEGGRGGTDNTGNLGNSFNGNGGNGGEIDLYCS
jgi:hypothetical protein